ncbi:GIY-YIG nuclease family protein [Streptomyces sp. SR27]|uniref:GIY-YIG nuclease family protein n=1 Tax=Streptomyces sp. SR27 TaxID=3076630 RepID=UPI003FA38266
MTSFVYMIGEEGESVVKIGKANSPADRLPSLQTGNPTLLRILWVHEGDRQLEGHLHAVFADYRVRGEWFDLAPLGDPVVAVQAAVDVAAHGLLPRPSRQGSRTSGRLPQNDAMSGAIDRVPCVCGHKPVVHGRDGCTVAGSEEHFDCQCERFVSEEVLHGIPAAQGSPLARVETKGWKGPTPPERVAACRDPRFASVLAEVEKTTWPDGRPALSGYWPEALATNILWRLQHLKDGAQQFATVLDEALRLQWPEGTAMLPGRLAEDLAHAVVARSLSVEDPATRASTSTSRQRPT